MRYVLVILLCCTIARSQEVIPPSIQNLHQKFLAAKVEKVSAPYEKAVQQLKAKYAQAIEKALEAAAERADLDAATALREEKRRLETEGDDLRESPGHAEVKDLREIYFDALETEEQSRTERLAPLTAQFVGLLQEKEAELTRANQLDEALAVREFRLQLAGPTSQGITQGPGAVQAGQLVMLGKRNGKDVVVPSELENIPIASIDFASKDEVVVCSPSDGIFSISDSGVKEISSEGALKTIAFGPWNGTTLSAENELRWIYRDDKKGRLDDVADFAVNYAPRTAGTLIALKKSGEIELEVVGARLGWDLQEWAAGKTFRSVECEGNGIEQAVFAIDSGGQMHAFTIDGPKSLPEAFSNDMLSITSAATATTLLAVKEGGQVFEITRNIYPLNLMDWSVPGIKRFDQRPVIFAQCEKRGKAVQHEDGTWTVWISRRGFLEEILPEVSGLGPLKQLRFVGGTPTNSYAVGIR